MPSTSPGDTGNPPQRKHPLSSSYIICTRDRPNDLVLCVPSILAQRPMPEELIIVDASLSAIACQNYEWTTAAVKGVDIKFQYLQSSRHSLPFQRNLGVEHASGDVLVFLDDDVVVLPGFHQKLLDLWDAFWQDGVGGIQGSDVNTPRPSLEGKLFRAIFMPGYNQRNFAQSVHPSWNQALNYLDTSDEHVEVEWMSGYAMSFKRQVFEHFGFDACLEGYALGEDIDFSYRVSRKYRLLRAGSAKAIHRLSDVARLHPRQFQEMLVVNRHYFFHKNIPPRIKYQVAYLWALCGIVLRAGFYTLSYKNAGYLVGVLGGIARILQNDVPGAVRAGEGG